MRVRLLRPARIRHEAGEIVEVSPAEYQFLISVGSAIDAPIKKAIETPEDNAEVLPKKRTKK